jgi:hypothetical protein
MTAAPKQTLVERVKEAILDACSCAWSDGQELEGNTDDLVKAALEACHAEEMISALNEIACWGDGDRVGGWFDEPGVATKARAILAKLEAKP